ncbi:MAG: hypothetical protein CGEMS_1723, partial [Candidatus Campylobacter infans]
TAYYTAKGTFKGSGTSNVTFDKITNALNKDGKLYVKGKIECVGVELPTVDNQTSGEVKLKLTFKKDDAVCKQLAKLPGILTMCQVDTTTTSEVSSTCEIQVGGSGGIQF